jgi:dihydropteroate synthase
MTIQPRHVYSLRLRSKTLSLGERTLLMGVLNVTADSFTDGGKYLHPEAALAQARRIIAAGADLLDIGAESTRPYADPVPLDLELQRVIPVIEQIRSLSDVPISIDTYKAEVARQAIAAGADIINDVSALRFDEKMVEVAAATGVPVILMHMHGTPRDMQTAPHYDSLFSEIIAFLEQRVQFAMANGVDRHQILVDPGIGFGKTVSHNLLLVRDLERFHVLDRPILLGASRKRFIGAILQRDVDDREVGSGVVHSLAIAAGVHVLRVHDVAFHRQVAVLGDCLRAGAWHGP